ncbi:family 10 glycosylhydrolase [Proteiniphilum sp.]|uniref:glycoside hydrolase family 10 protein n=1 Tax=Proteiniphilum sp. TaxID=1926877 RepID=UPI00331F607A
MAHKIFPLLILFLTGATGLFASGPPATEVRAVWLTTNYGLDWPRNRTSLEVQKRELTEILDNLKKHNFNTVFFQVRGRGEVLYNSRIEPMSSLIAPAGPGRPPFDPLAFAVEECHKRGLACHAWVVTYPLGNDRHVRSLGTQSVTKKNPSLTKQFQREWFLDPGNPRTDDYLLSIVKEIVAGYDIDGIHFDYIRYPDNRGRFPDDGMYRQYGKGKSRDEWRRDNITRFVIKVYDQVKAMKPWVQVSSAPLGRYRALGNNGVGWTALETVSQDAGKWMMMGKHDAIYPMMYYKERLFYPFVDDWLKHSNGRIVVPGLGAYQMIELGWSYRDILNQVDYTRQNDSHGQAYFRTENVLSNTKGILRELEEYYKYPAKLPPMTWLSDSIPNNPYDLRAEKNGEGLLELSWEGNRDGRVTYNVYRSENDTLSLENAEELMAVGLREPMFRYKAGNNDKAYYYYITASDAYNNESGPCIPAFFYHSETVK